MAKSKTITVNVVLPIVVTTEGQGKLDIHQLKGSIIDHISQDYVEENFVDALLNDQDEFEGVMRFGTVSFINKKSKKKK